MTRIPFRPSAIFVSTSMALMLTVIGLTSPDALKQPLEIPEVHAFDPDAIEFYGVDFSGDTFVWCFDRSCSMGWQNLLEPLKQEILFSLDQLSPDQEFGLVPVSSASFPFAYILRPGLQSYKNLAATWLDGISPAGWNCLEAGLLQSLDLAQQSQGPDARVILVGGSLPICNGVDTTQEVLDAVGAANTTDIPIHGVYLESDAEGAAYYQQLASENGGISYEPDVALPPIFRRGDADGDGVVTGLVDGVFILTFQFVPGSPAPGCLDAADVDDNGAVSGLIDGVALLNFTFVPGSPPPPAPGPICCAFDPTGDDLDCGLSPACP